MLYEWHIPWGKYEALKFIHAHNKKIRNTSRPYRSLFNVYPYDNGGRQH